MKYFIKPDLFTIVISIVCLVIVGYILVKTFEHHPTWYSFFIRLFIVIVFAYFAIKMPVYTYVDDNTIAVKQLIGGKTFSRDTIVVRKVLSSEMKGTVRLFGSGGFLGYTGWFSNPALGKFYMLTVSKKDLLLILTATGKKYVINCPWN